jgi:isopentenyl-diphosphate delta-isomerase type 1
MSEEWFDIVDANDRVIGRKPRHEVHRLGLRHRAVHVLVFNTAGQIFLQQRSASKDCHPGVWDSSASGHVEAGEAYDDCSVRELNEELGLLAEAPIDRLFKIDACPETGDEFVWVYHTHTSREPRVNPAEIQEGRWYDPSAVDEWTQHRPTDFAPAFLVVWARFRGQGPLPG